MISNLMLATIMGKAGSVVAPGCESQEVVEAVVAVYSQVNVRDVYEWA